MDDRIVVTWFVRFRSEYLNGPIEVLDIRHNEKFLLDDSIHQGLVANGVVSIHKTNFQTDLYIMDLKKFKADKWTGSDIFNKSIREYKIKELLDIP
jgi:hypothetical protein